MQQFILDRAVSKACMHLRNCFGGNHLYFVLYKGDKISEGIFIVTSNGAKNRPHFSNSNFGEHFILEFTTDQKILSEILNCGTQNATRINVENYRRKGWGLYAITPITPISSDAPKKSSQISDPSSPLSYLRCLIKHSDRRSQMLNKAFRSQMLKPSHLRW